MAEIPPWEIFAIIVAICAVLIIVWFNWRFIRKCSYAARGKKVPQDIENDGFRGDDNIQH